MRTATPNYFLTQLHDNKKKKTYQEVVVILHSGLAVHPVGSLVVLQRPHGFQNRGPVLLEADVDHQGTERWPRRIDEGLIHEVPVWRHLRVTLRSNAGDFMLYFM